MHTIPVARTMQEGAAVLRSLLAAAALGVMVPAAPALADRSEPRIEVAIAARHGDSRRHDRHEEDRGVSRRQAARIAGDYGVVDIDDISMRRGVWRVSGETWRGRELIVEISARTGRVLEVRYRDRGRGRWRGW
jgi:hypothetical protein